MTATTISDSDDNSDSDKTEGDYMNNAEMKHAKAVYEPQQWTKESTHNKDKIN